MYFQKIVILMIFVLFYSCNKQGNKVYLVKQWHLSSHQKTTDINASKKLPQFKNQKDIYLQLESMIKAKKTSVIIAEGCEGHIDKNFNTSFNGWTMKLLIEKKKDPSYADIMAPVPMKIKAAFPEVKVVCGDNEELITKNLKAMSDLRGFSGFYQRLVENKLKNPKKFDVYSKQLKKLFPDVKNPIQFTLNKSLEALKQFEFYIKERNISFEKAIEKNIKNNPVVVIGGLHIQDLEQKMHVRNIKFETITPNGYSNDEQKLLFALKEILTNEQKSEITYFQVPYGFKINEFPATNLISLEKLFTTNELVEIKKLLPKEISLKLLQSDFDNDGIRDFTLSSHPHGIVISAEDPDWDNDGLDNLKDKTIGKKKLNLVSNELKINNHFLSQKSKEDVLKGIDKKISLLNFDSAHELLVLEIFSVLTAKTTAKNNNIKIILATTPSFSYGENVFFSYIAHTNVLEYYPEKLNNFINQEYQKRFKGVEFKKYINSYVIPLIIHSLAHEIGHSLNLDEDKTAKENSWTWDDVNYKGLYLKSFRHPTKIMKSIKTNLKYNGKTSKELFSEHKKYLADISKAMKRITTEEKLAEAKKSKFFIKNNSKQIEHRLSFLNTMKLPSVYSFSKPSEWFAESYATCIYKKIYPNSKELIRAIELEHLLGINPLASSEKFCSRIELKTP